MRAVVTGGGRGLGLAFVQALVDQGHEVVATVRRPEAARVLQDMGRTGLTVMQLDVSDTESIERFGRELSGHWRGVDVLINNAGINSRGVPDGQGNVRLGALEPEGILRMVSVNAIGPTLVTQTLLPLLEAGDTPRVLHVSSWLGSVTRKQSGGNYGYCASKATLNMLARALAFDLAERGIASVVANPGWVQTDMGGSRAQLTPRQSVAGLLDALWATTLETSGRFVQWDGTEHPW